MSKQKQQVDAEHVFLPLVVLFALQGQRPYGPTAPFYGSAYRPGYGPYYRPWPYRSW